ncbi:MAG: c-type cytochrome [Anaerolineae bacterium]|nr:c-type cytochrome [Anaerolineae bacterium]
MTKNSGADFSFLLVAGFILIAGVVCSVLWLQSIQPSEQRVASVDTTISSTGGGFWARFHRGRRVRVETAAAAAPETAPAEVSSEAGAVGGADSEIDAVIAVVNAAGCQACHTIPGIPNAVGQIGPDLSNIGTNAATRREGYSAEQYIRESLVEPGAFTAPDCPTGPCVAGIMVIPPLTDEQIDTMVNYLLTLTAN